MRAKIIDVMEDIARTISTDNNFKNIPIFYDMLELNPNNLPPYAIVLQAKTWTYNHKYCNTERQLDICLISGTKHSRSLILQLFNHMEQMKELLDKYMLTINFDMEFIGGSEIKGKQTVKKDNESYKTTGTVFASIVTLSYYLRY